MYEEHQDRLQSLLMWATICMTVILSIAYFIFDMEEQHFVASSFVKKKDMIIPVNEILEKEEFELDEIEYYDGEISTAELLVFLYEIDLTNCSIKIDNTNIPAEWIIGLKQGTNSSLIALLSEDAVYTRYYYLGNAYTVTKIVFIKKFEDL